MSRPYVHSYRGWTSWGTVVCAALSASRPPRNIWPALPETVTSTVDGQQQAVSSHTHTHTHYKHKNMIDKHGSTDRVDNQTSTLQLGLFVTKITKTFGMISWKFSLLVPTCPLNYGGRRKNGIFFSSFLPETEMKRSIWCHSVTGPRGYLIARARWFCGS